VTTAAERDAQFAAYVAARSGALLRSAYLLTGDRAAAEDLLQAALLKVYLAWPRISRREAVDSYLRTTLVRTRISLWRKGTWREYSVDWADDAVAGTDPSDRVVDRDELWRLLATLGARQRAVLVLRFYEDLTEPQIAQVLGCSVGTVKSQLSRGLARLRDHLVTGPAAGARAREQR
jgi:RNA polymerase sigma-70 factor, ECF subfamily